jgi:hypothetical protein
LTLKKKAVATVTCGSFLIFMSYYKIVYDKLFPYAPYLNERIGIEILVESSQDPMDALEEARKIVHDFRNKHIQAELSHQLEPIIEGVPDIKVQKSTAQSLEEQILACTYIKGENDDGLMSFKVIAEMNPRLKEVFWNKMEELQTQKTKL